MATVTSITAARAEQIEDNSVVSGHISGSDLVLVTGGGTSINVGRVIQPAANNWPVGSIFMHSTETNPNLLLGGGTWARWGRGRVPVSVDEGDPQFNAYNLTGGAKTHTLTTAEMPYHSHGGGTGTDSPDHAHSGGSDWANADHAHGVYIGTTTDGGHIHALSKRAAAGSTEIAGGSGAGAGAANTDNRGDHSHIVSGGTGGMNANHAHSVSVGGASARHAHSITAEGGNAAHNNMPPYITVYMWIRTA